MLSLCGYFFGMFLSGFFFSSWWDLVFFYFVLVFFLVFFGYGYDGFFWLLSSGMGLDLMGWGLVILSVFLGGLILMAGGSGKDDFFYYSLVSMLVFFLILSFIVLDYVWFYFFFETSLIPIFLIIVGWGYQPERLMAGVYLMFYTIFGSLPLLLSYLYMLSIFSSSSYGLLWWYQGGGVLWLVFGISAFLIKMPMFLSHLWLPSAHVEAPVGGSMMLAGVLLKLGGYGIFRLLGYFLCSSFFGLWIISVSLIGGVVVSFLCLRQFDIKALIAYSSVAHMGLVLGGIFVINSWGWGGAYALMIGHGLCSSGLFCFSGVFYERLGSRSMFLSKGLSLVFPGLSLWWILLSVGNMAAPPSVNLMGEIMLLISLYLWSSYVLIVLVFISFFGAAYTLYLYSIAQHGDFGHSYGLKGESVREHYVFLLHWLPVNLFVLKGDMFYFWY